MSLPAAAALKNDDDDDHQQQEYYDSDIDSLAETDNQFQWRRDPELTHSDWTIEIVVLNNDNTNDKDEVGEEESSNELPPKKKLKTSRDGEAGGDSSSNKGSSAGHDDGGSDSFQPSSVQTYHVHKYCLGCGPHKSSYFERLFQNAERFVEGDQRTSRIELHELAAQAFPHLLDFVYSSPTTSNDDNGIEINTSNATALYYLGQYFGIKRLRRLAKQFWMNDMSLDNINIYYMHSKIFQDEKIYDSIVKFCSEPAFILEIEKDSPIVKVSDSKFWLAITQKAHGHIPDDIRNSFYAFEGPLAKEAIVHLSSLIAENVVENENDITFETFQKMTGEDLLPRIAFDAAQQLSDLEDKLADANEDGSNNKKTPTYSKNRDIDLSNLQKRCIASIAGGWEEPICFGNREYKEFLKRKNPAFLTELLHKTRVQACRELLMVRSDLERRQGEVTELKKENKKLKRKVRRLENGET